LILTFPGHARRHGRRHRRRRLRRTGIGPKPARRDARRAEPGGRLRRCVRRDVRGPAGPSGSGFRGAYGM